MCEIYVSGIVEVRFVQFLKNKPLQFLEGHLQRKLKIKSFFLFVCFLIWKTFGLNGLQATDFS